jgi:hypothetical protein
MHIIKPIARIIAEYAAEYKLRRWIPLNKINWGYLSSNPNDGAIALLEDQLKATPAKINWDWLSRNPNDGAIALLQQNPNKIDWWMLSGNPNDGAIALLKDNQDKIDWLYLSGDPNIFKLNTKAIYTNLC